MSHPKVDARLARRAGRKVELLDAMNVVDPVSRLLIVRINVREPTNAPTRSVLEIYAVPIE